MPSPETLLVFAVASAGLVLLPGPAVIYIVTRGVVHGRRGALVSTVGIETGNMVEVLAASFGLAALVASSAAAFSIVRWAGAAYLVWLGVRALRSGSPLRERPAEEKLPSRRLFWHGFAVGALNPKLALFLLAFLPQFIDPSAGPVWLQTLVLGCVFSLVAAAGDTAFALAASAAGARVRRWLRGRRLARASGVVYMGLGISAALSGAGEVDT